VIGKATPKWRIAPANGTIFLILIAWTLAVRVQTFGNPFIGFDEQFYLLVGDRMLHGALPYVDIFDRKPIGLFLIFAGIRRLGGLGIVEYQLTAAALAAATGFGIYTLARRIAPWIGALAAAAAYVLWLDLTECEGGQAPVFFALPMVAAALLVARALECEHARVIAPLGSAAMLLTGIAMQIKYTALFEGVVFGLALLWSAWRNGERSARLAALGLLWILCALLPTALAAAYYAHLGQLPAFVFANFRSLGGRLPDPLPRRLIGLGAILLVLCPLLAFVRPRLHDVAPFQLFLTAWLAAALLSIVGFGSWLAVHYAAPALVPLTIAAAPAIARHRRAATGLLAFGLVAGQVLIALNITHKGTRVQALALAAAAEPHSGGKLYVYNGPPALYLLTGSPLPTRWPFPGHLNTADEASAAAIGTDPTAEVRGIMASRPDTVVDTAPSYALGNSVTHAVLRKALTRDYLLSFRQALSGGKVRLVYHLRLRSS